MAQRTGRTAPPAGQARRTRCLVAGARRPRTAGFVAPFGRLIRGRWGRRWSGARRTAPARAPVARRGLVPGGPAAADLTEEWPDDAGPAESSAGPTGMALIERQLGGTIIEEIDEP